MTSTATAAVENTSRPHWTPAQLARLLGQPEPTAEQAAVISAPLTPSVVVAGAGSGKSETMAARVVWLVANGYVRPEQVLGLTFTRKAAAELAERVRKRLDQLRGVEAIPAETLDGEPAVSTYHSYAARIVGDHALREAIEPTIRLVTDAVAWQLAARVVSTYDGPMDAITATPATVTAAVLELAGELAEHLRHPDDVREIGDWLRRRAAALPRKPLKITMELLATQAKREQLLPLVERYAAAKAAREVMDYGDQVALAARVAERHAEVGLIERDRYRVVLLDEYQDTSHAQLVLLRALFGAGHPVTAVGDPCQSIYGWRGASSGNLLSFPTDFPERPGRPAPVRQLATSFRNGERILEVAKAVSEPLRAESALGHVPVLHPGPERRGRGAVSCALFDTDTREAEWIAEQIALAVEAPGQRAPDGQPWDPPGGDRRLTPGDVAILCRKRSQFPPLREALEKRGLPVEVVGLGGLLTVPEVRDIVATLRVLHDPTAGGELVRLLTGPRWRLGPRDLVALGGRAKELAEQTHRDLERERAGEHSEAGTDLLRQTVLDLTAESGSLVDALDDPGPAENYSEAGYQRLTRFGAELRGLRRLAAQSLPELVGEVERTLGLDIEVAARPGQDPVASRADLDAFHDAAIRFVGNSEDPTLGTFLAYLNSAEETEHGLESGRVGSSDSVKLMTAHAAKGLQWPLVVVPGLSGGRTSPLFPAKPRRSSSWVRNELKLPFPLRGDRADLPDLVDVDKPSIEEFEAANRAREEMEERRLAYVAVTRASFALLCTGHWWGPAAGRRGPSVFLEEVRDVCAAGGGRVAHWAPPPEEDETNPRLADTEPVDWPRPPEELASKAGAGHTESLAAARMVATAREGAGGRWLELLERAEMPVAMRRRLDGWSRDVELLLAHGDPAAGGSGVRGDDGALPVELPMHLSVSSLVSLARDPAALARQIRRPLPRPPAPHTRRGTAFHSWLEARFGQESLLEPGELPGAADDTVGADGDFAELRRRFEASEWGGLIPIEVEVPFETMIGDRLVRGRIDAVFHDPATGHYDLLDWKTGRSPGTGPERRAAAVQLAAYRVAWADLMGVPLENVRAAFHYVRSGETVRPVNLLDGEGLARLIEGVPEGH